MNAEQSSLQLTSIQALITSPDGGRASQRHPELKPQAKEKGSQAPIAGVPAGPLLQLH